MANDDIPLKDHVLSLFEASGKRLDAYVNQHREMHEKLAEQVIQAASAVDKRLEQMNELRSQINTERGQFVTRDMLDQRSNAVDLRFAEISRNTGQRLDEIIKRVSDAERSRANLDGRFSMLAMVLGGLTILLNLIFGYLAKGH